MAAYNPFKISTHTDLSKTSSENVEKYPWILWTVLRDSIDTKALLLFVRKVPSYCILEVQ